MANASAPPTSRETSNRDRFLVKLLHRGFEKQWRAPADFLERFPPKAIMTALKEEPELRAKLLVTTTGVHEKIARKKCVDGASEDLALALEEGITDPSSILEAFGPSEWVEFFDPRDLWEWLAGSEFWRKGSGAGVEELHFVLETARERGLLSYRDVFDGVTIDEITAALPPAELRAVLAHALRKGRADGPLDEACFLEVVPLRALLGYVSADHTWERVVVQKIAEPAGLADVDATPIEAAPPPPSVHDEPTKVQPIDPAQAAASANAEDPEVTDASIEVEVDVDVEPKPRKVPSRPPYEDAARARVVGKLEEAGRLPPRHHCLSLQNLLSLEAMYGELPHVADDAAREAAIRDAFPNDSALRTTMLALIELLDPTIDTHEPVIRDADVEALIKVVLFEERIRGEKKRKADETPARATSVAATPPPLPASAKPMPLTPLPPPPSARRAPPPPSSLPPPPNVRAYAPPSVPPPPRRSTHRLGGLGSRSAELPSISLAQLERDALG